MNIQDPSIGVIALSAILFAVVACAISFQQLRVVWRHIGMKRLNYINTIAAPTAVAEHRAPMKFPEEPFDVDAYIKKISAPQPPEPVGELEYWSIANWCRLPASVRKQCVDYLRDQLSQYPDGAVVLAKWCEQKKNGYRIGHDEWGFHHGHGMWVRNILRNVLEDRYLPAVSYAHAGGEKFSNWDDYYYGALNQLASGDV